jgi:hypothetical protein
MSKLPWPGPSNDTQRQVLADLEGQVVAEQLYVEQGLSVQRDRIALLEAGAAAGVPTWAMADALGVTPGRVSQLVKRPLPEEPTDLLGIPFDQWGHLV